MSKLTAKIKEDIDFWREAGSFVAGNEKLLVEIVWPHFWAIHIVLVMLISMYCTMSELFRVLGRGKMRHLLFGPRPSFFFNICQ